MNTTKPEVVFVDLNPELAARLMSIVTANPDVALVVSALMTDAAKFVVGDMTRLDMESAAQSFVASAQDLQVKCDECRGWGVFQLSPSAPRCECEECSGRGWTWRNGSVEK